MATGTDSPTYKRALSKAHRQLVDEINPVELLDVFIEKEFLTELALRDIREQKLTSVKNRMILEKVSRMGNSGYKVFKECLKKSKHDHLVELLNKKEEDIKAEKKRSSKTQKSTKSEVVFRLSGFTIRGFHKTKENWVPKKGKICKLEITEKGAVAVRVDGAEAGSVSSEVSHIVRKCMRSGMTVKAKVSSVIPVRSQEMGEEIKCFYCFSGPGTPVIQNLAKEVEQEIKSKNKGLQKQKFGFLDQTK